MTATLQTTAPARGLFCPLRGRCGSVELGWPESSPAPNLCNPQPTPTLASCTEGSTKEAGVGLWSLYVNQKVSGPTEPVRL